MNQSELGELGKDYRGGIQPATAEEWHRLAGWRIEESEILLRAEKWNGAIYLAGLAVECRIKWFAAVTKMNVPYGHDLENLATDVGLIEFLLGQIPQEWRHVVFWYVEIRYESQALTQFQAERFFFAASRIMDIIETKSKGG